MIKIYYLLLTCLLLSSCVEPYSIKYSNIQSNAETFVPVPFTSVWKVGDPLYGDGDLTVTLPLVTGYIYDFTIDWGDGSALATVTSFDDVDINHSYAAPGDYTITILGVLEAWSFADNGDKSKIIAVTDLGNTRMLNLHEGFFGCDKLLSFAGGNTSKVISMAYMFSFTGLTSADFSSFNTTAVTNMKAMFYGAGDLITLDLSSFETPNVTNMSVMFSETWNLSTLNISNFDTSAVTNMAQMFENAQGLTSLDLSHFDTGNVLSMSSMFQWADGLTSINLSSFNTSKVTDMSYMFYNARGVTTLNLSNFNTISVTDMTWMFASTWDLITINATNWDISNVIASGGIYGGGNPALVVTCNQGGTPASGNLFGEACF